MRRLNDLLTNILEQSDLDREKTDVKLLSGLIKNVPFFQMYFYFIAAKKVHLPQLSFLRLSVICRISLGQVFH